MSDAVVGTYPTEDAARVAEDRLRANGFTRVGVQSADDDVWQVTVPDANRDGALDELRRMERDISATHGP
jgi:hypothetical protein